jgi:hypothetical protein
MPDEQASAGARSAHTPLVHLLNRSSEPLAACFDARDYRAAVPSQAGSAETTALSDSNDAENEPRCHDDLALIHAHDARTHQPR